jgi:hypothetical protein
MSIYKDYPTIAGAAAGRRVTINPDLHNTYKRLEQAALRGNHWARIAVKELNALTTGLSGKNNVYISRFGGSKNAVGEKAFYVFLPGLKATVYPGAVGQYHVTDLVLDANYFEATEEIRERTRMGLYRAKLQDGRLWEAEYIKDGKVLPQDYRLVAIADSGYATAGDAAKKAIPIAMKQPGVPTDGVRRDGCDLHFTPGNKRLGGMIRYNALREDDSRASALHLAATMQQAQSTKGVRWVADRGGSAVLTQAMQILADRGIILEGHTAYLYKPSTSPGDALRLAHTLKLTLNESFADTSWNLQGAFSQLTVAGQRLKNADDPYSKGYHAQAWINGVVKAGGTLGLAGTAATAMGASIPMLAGVVGAISTVGALYAMGPSLLENLSHKFKR